ncbi:C1 family peptidase [Actinocrispum sp. NPDC049592]|uniref:C1 family peptidase n=1 Tax=Actinocrispum sp. NPDC049592 TaxID=3154835 RepID=UPI003433F616
MSDKSMNRRGALRLGVIAGAAAAGLVSPAVASARTGDIEAHRRAVAAANVAAEANGLVHVPDVDTPDSVSLAGYQTSFKNQGGRGTCYAFAACAAMEAAYKRKYGVDLDLSEQFAFHINKAGELYDDYMTTTVPHENNSSYWGFQGSSDIVDKLARSAIPVESLAPYGDGPAWERLRTDNPGCGALDWNSSQEQLDVFEFLEGHIPTRSRHQAKYRVTGYAAIPGNPSPSDIEKVIASGREVVVDVPGHATLIVGYDRNRRVYLIKNSWGEGKIIESSYDSTSWPILGGRYITDVDAVNAAPQWDAFWVGRWQMDHDGWRGELVIRRTTNYRRSQGQPTKLGNYYRDGKSYDVNGVTAQNGQALHFWIADQPGKVQPGTASGQEFWAYVYSFAPTLAAGSTSWSGIPFGVSLSRSALPGRPTSGFVANDWIGTWAMNHDGWTGTLRVTSVAPFSASYTHEDGRTLAVTGGLDSAHPHVIRARIGFAADDQRPFQLYAHTWEKDIFSGTTQWGGQNYGVNGRRV